MSLVFLLSNVASLSTSFGALVALAILTSQSRSRGLSLLLGAVFFLSTDYMLGVILYAPVDSSLWQGLPGFATKDRTAVLLGLKGICHIVILLTAPPAIQLLFGRKLPKAEVVTGIAAVAVMLIILVLLIGGAIPYTPVAVFGVITIPAYAAYLTCLVTLLRQRSVVSERGFPRTVLNSSIVALSLFIPTLLIVDILGLFKGMPRTLPIVPLAFLALTSGILVFSILGILDIRKERVVPDLEGFCAEHALSVRECDVIHLLVEGLRYKEIADRLGISLDTVKTHVSRIYRKTSASGKTDLLYRIGSIPRR
jgi:DNA-binding CsgD family transcriptional regulator